MRSFLFKDFQLAPTLEEYRRLAGTPATDKGPYTEIGKVPTKKELAEALGIKVIDLEKHYKVRRDGQGIPSSYLEKKALELSTLPDKEAFINTLALLIYGLVLFPTFEDFVDAPAISVFWAVLKKDQDPICLLYTSPSPRD